MSKKWKAKFGPRATKMVTAVDQKAASVKEVATLPLPKEARGLPAKSGWGIPSGYEQTAAPMDDDPGDMQYHAALGTLQNLSKAQKDQVTCSESKSAWKSKLQ